MTTESEAFGQSTVELDEIDPRSRSIAEKRAIGLTHAQIADLHGVSTKTVQRTLERPGLRDLVAEIQSEMFSASTARLLGLNDVAIQTLERLLASESDSVALRAASKVLDLAGSLVAHVAMEQRVAGLVEEINARIEDL